MTPRPTPPDPWNRFLEAEGEGRTVEAEAALGALFAQLPRRLPAAGFPDRVLARVRASAVGRVSPFNRRPVRWALAASLVAAALATALLVPLLPALASLVGPGALLRLTTEGFTELVVRFATGAAAWGPLANAAGAVGRVLVEPRWIALLALQFVIAALALKGLSVVVSQSRSSAHVSS